MCIEKLWMKKSFTHVKIVEQSFHQKKSDCIVKFVNQI